MKRILPYLLVLLAVACNKGEEESRLVLVSQDNLTIAGKTGKGNISFSTNRPWKVSSSVEWCTVSPSWGDGNVERVHDLFVVCEDNDGKDSRECIITIESGDKTITLPVVQNHIDGLCIDVHEYSVGQDAGELKVEIWSNVQDIELITTGNVSWISMSKTKSMVLGSITLDIERNTGPKRSSTVILAGGDKQETITIYQDPSSINIPDEALRNAAASFDTDHDGHISIQEALKATSLRIPDGVQSLDGIEYFKNVTYLSIEAKSLRTFDFGIFPQTKYLKVYSPIDTLDFRSIPKLREVIIYNSHKTFITGPAESLNYLNLQGSFETIQLSSLPNLTLMLVGASFGGPDNIDLSCIQGAFELYFSCPYPSTLTAASSGIKSITFSNTTPYCDKQFIKKLVFKDCPNLEKICVYHDNGMEELVCSGNPALTMLFYSRHDKSKSLTKALVADCPSLSQIDILGADLGSLPLKGLPALNMLLCRNCGLQSLDLTGVPSVESLNCTANPDLHTVYCKKIPRSVNYDKDVTSFVVVD